MNKKTINTYFLLGIIILLHITGWLLLKPVWPLSDDYWYSFHAHDLLTQPFHLSSNHFQNRLGVYVPVSILFNYFGINPYTISLWPLIISVFSISIVFLFVEKLLNTTVAFISSFLISTNILQMTYSIALFPDLIVSFYCIAIVLLFYYGRERKPKQVIYPILINVLLIIGFLTKETILLIGPFILIVLIYDLYRKRNILFWKRTLFLGFCSLVFLSLMYYLITGDAFHRIRLMVDFVDHKMMRPAIEEQITSIWSSNIFRWFNNELGYIFLLLFSIPAFFTLKQEKLNSFKTYIAAYSILLLIEYIVLFHTKKYGVVIMCDRMWMLLIAPLSILSAYFIFKAENKFYIVLAVMLLLLAITNYYFINLNRALLFVMFLFAVISSYYLRKLNNKWSLILLLPFLILCIHFIYRNSNYRIGSLDPVDFSYRIKYILPNPFLKY